MVQKRSNQEINSKAFLICLSNPINNMMHDTTLQIEILLSVIAKSKSNSDFEKAQELLMDLTKQQERLGIHLAKLILDMKLPVVEKAQPEAKVH